MCTAQVIYDTEDLSVDFTQGTWAFTSFHEAAWEWNRPPYPQNIYPLQYQRDKTWLLKFPLKTGGRLIVPCLEFFARCYGRSGEFNLESAVDRSVCFFSLLHDNKNNRFPSGALISGIPIALTISSQLISMTPPGPPPSRTITASLLLLPADAGYTVYATLIFFS